MATAIRTFPARSLLACAFVAMTSLATPARVDAATRQEPDPPQHASSALIELAAEFHAFRSPLFRPRTWRPTWRFEGVADYAAVQREQLAGVERFRARLAAIDPTGWPVHDQVDYLLLRSEMDDVWFEHQVLREVQTNPLYYAEQAVNAVAEAIPGVVPYDEETAEDIVAALERTAPILEQARRNLRFDEAAPELADAAIKHLDNIEAKYRAGVELFSPHFPVDRRASLERAAGDAAKALSAYRQWLVKHRGDMRGQAHVGEEALYWFMRRVNFVPWSREELLSLAEHEKNRFLMSIEIEETKNAGLPELTMPTTEEWIEWFRLTYLQTKYWLKDRDIISFPAYVGESVLETGAWQEPFGGLGNRPGLLGFATQGKPANTKRLFVVPEDHWFTQTYWERTMRLDPITDYQHSDWPGHYFEAEVTKRNPCPIRAIHRDTGFSQGWAHYWEEFFMDMGYPFLRGPRTRELTYNFLLLRAVRVPMDLYLSEGSLSMEEAIRYQIDRVPTMEEHISRAEVEMYVRWPYQATSYIVGKKQIEQILADRIYASDFSIDWRAFHDEMLDYGQIAPALVRWEMTGNDDQVSGFWKDAAVPQGD